MALHITDRQTADTPVGNPAFWITVTGPTSEYRNVGAVAGAHARKVAARLGRGRIRAYRITSGNSWNHPSKGEFEERVLYAFAHGDPR